MGITVWILAILVIVGLLAIGLAWNSKRKGVVQETNYRTYFIMGLVMFPIGLIGMIISFFRDYSFFTMLPFFTIGIVYLALGWIKRSKWKKSE